jgi:hypothetical protein
LNKQAIMPLQYITDAAGEHTAVLIPITEWELITRKHEDLKSLETVAAKPKVKLSDLAGKLSYETAEAMLNYVQEGRNEWEERLKKQL